MWDARFSKQEYVYGTTPNDFLKDQVNSIPKGKVLSLAEGEGKKLFFSLSKVTR